MAEPMSSLSPEKLNASIYPTDEDDMTWHDPPSSPFVSHIESDQENIAPGAMAPTPAKPLIDFDENPPQSAFKIPTSKSLGTKERNSPVKPTPSQRLLDDFEEDSFSTSDARVSPKKTSPVKQIQTDRPDSALSSRSSKMSPIKLSRTPSAEVAERLSSSIRSTTPDGLPASHHIGPTYSEPALRDNEGLTQAIRMVDTEAELRDNEGLTVAIKSIEESRSESYESSTTYHAQADITDFDEFGMDNTEFGPDGPDLTSADIDDTCFSTFSEMPNLDMTKFAGLNKSPTRKGLYDPATPRARAQMTPSTVQRSERTPSPTPRRQHKDNDTTNLLLDFTAQIEAFSVSRRASPSRGRTSPTKSSTEPNLLSYIQNQRSPAKGSSAQVPATPSQNRQLLNLLDFELPPPPTPRSVPTVTIRELESLKSTMQSQISSLTASLSGKEAEVDSLVKAISGAERRVGEAQEQLRDERSAREHAEAQMEDWKKKGEEVQKILQDVQSELARNDTERDALLTRLAEAEKRAEEAEAHASELETRAIEAESKNVDMTTFLSPEDDENKKIYSEIECQAAIAEKVNDVARDLHTAYKAKHEKKIKALKENYQKKADERCKELRVQIIRLERQVEEAEKKRDDTFSKVVPPEFAESKDGVPTATPPTSNAEDLKTIETQKAEIENLKAKLAGLQSELSSLRKSQDVLMQELEAERVEKGELVAAAEQMLALCGEKMGEIQQEELRKSHLGGAPPSAPAPTSTANNRTAPSMRSTGFLAGGAPVSSISRPESALGGGRPTSAMGDRLGAMGGASAKPATTSVPKPSGLKAPGGGFGFKGPSGSALGRSTSGSNKSRLMSNIERMGGGKNGE
ncbi:hypothetical protein BU24DRAFT_386485 [Aaosphaeria arxii CBS 175.79]|uniref:Uncharacterized protein n=1 Tax=Aaosphaeria arxii CBS 175.79 TaxID=1450172 RepID=A0A6A5Y3U5_9PLEO|nr:uncharacterized protein BU24DRAFT_386485 [Aaosphaeria arxii CBS 175.79]KAF2019541.1 hypothetical protein BU24DRAFT_386485 [Aaosphaeria arxii CBS 175.79]